MDQLPRLGKRELICLLLFTCNYVVSVWRGFLFLWVLGMGYVILMWHSLSLPYIYLKFKRSCFVLTSHNTSMCSVMLTPHQLKIVELQNINRYFHEILNIYSTDVALYEIHMLLNRYAYLVP